MRPPLEGVRRILECGSVGVDHLQWLRIALGSSFATATSHAPHERLPFRTPHPMVTRAQASQASSDGRSTGPISCRHFGTCGGCSLHHLPYEAQLAEKLAFLRTTLREVPGATSAIKDFTPWERRSAEDRPGFRCKVHFVLDSKGPGTLRLGHYAADSRQFVAISECPVHATEGNEAARVLVELANALGLEAIPRGPLRHVIVRVSEHTRGVGVTIVVRRSDDRLPVLARRVAGRLPHLRFFAVNVKDDDGPLLTTRDTTILVKKQELVEHVAGSRFVLSPTGFFQTNVRAAERLLHAVLQVTGGGGALRVLDLYAGVGLFAIPLAQAGHRVVAVEGNPAAAVDCVRSVRLNGIPRAACRVLQQPDRRALQLLQRERARFDVVVLDPPRAGCRPEVLRNVLATFQPRRVVYVSCDARSLARDLGAVLNTASGVHYSLQSIQPLDMFPYTPHVETVSVLSRVS